MCRTDLHVVDGELPDPTLPIVPGHEIVGVIDAAGAETSRQIGERVGIPWLGYTCGHCGYCRSGQENLCDLARFTGYQIDGGYADYTLADERFCLALPPQLDDLHTAPLLCAGLIGYRCLVKAGDARAARAVRFRRRRAPDRAARATPAARGLRLRPARR